MNNKVIVNENYLKLLEQGIPMEHIRMYMNAEPGFVQVSPTVKLPYSEVGPGPDVRYNEPKSEPKSSQELADKVIVETEIYREAKLALLRSMMYSSTPEINVRMLQAQRKQVAYGLDKYPEPLNPNTWSTVETIDHIVDESIDKLHYLVMLRIKTEQEIVETGMDLSGRLQNINGMIDTLAEELDYLIGLSLESEMEEAVRKDDSMDAMSYAMRYMDVCSMYPGAIYADNELVGYCMADIEATHEVYRNMMAGADMDGDACVEFEEDEPVEEPKEQNFTININVDGSVNPDKIAHALISALQAGGFRVGF